MLNMERGRHLTKKEPPFWGPMPANNDSLHAPETSHEQIHDRSRRFSRPGVQGFRGSVPSFQLKSADLTLARGKSFRIRKQRRFQCKQQSPNIASWMSHGLRRLLPATAFLHLCFFEGRGEVPARLRGLAVAYLFGKASQMGGAAA